MAGGVALAPGVVVVGAGVAAEAPSGAIVSVAGGVVPVAAAGVAAGGIKLVPGASAGAARNRSPKCRRQSSSVIWNGLVPGAWCQRRRGRWRLTGAWCRRSRSLCANGFFKHGP